MIITVSWVLLSPLSDINIYIYRNIVLPTEVADLKCWRSRQPPVCDYAHIVASLILHLMTPNDAVMLTKLVQSHFRIWYFGLSLATDTIFQNLYWTFVKHNIFITFFVSDIIHDIFAICKFTRLSSKTNLFIYNCKKNTNIYINSQVNLLKETYQNAVLEF